MKPSSRSLRIRPWLGLILASALHASASPKSTLLLPMNDTPGWCDMAFLAAIPASEFANRSGASLITIEPDTPVGPEILDYLRRYQPSAIHLLGRQDLSPIRLDLPGLPATRIARLPSTSAEEAALSLSRTFWRDSSTVVLCKNDDYPSALLAAPLATLLQSPLLYTGDKGLSPDTQAEMKRLGSVRVITVGPLPPIAHAIHLAGAEEVARWTRQQNIDVSYLAAVNPLDRATSKVRKLSLVGAQLAAGRKGLVVPLSFAVEWKKPFKSKPADKNLPERFHNQGYPARTGTLQAGQAAISYILTGNPAGSDQSLFIHPGPSGPFTGPLRSGDSIDLDGRKWTLSLGAGGSYHDADVHVTWPQVDVLTRRLHDFYQILGRPPEHLCLAGLPDTVPQHLVRGHLSSPDVATDLPYAMIDNDPSSCIAVGRVVAEDVRFGSLYAARVLTFRDLLNGDWANRACQAEWENSFSTLFAHAGFDASYRLTDEDIPWTRKPSQGIKGIPGPGFTSDSPVTRAQLVCHMNHSWNFELGRMMKWDASTLVAPSVVESGGCGTTSLDRSAPGQLIVEGATGAQSPELAFKHRSVVSRLFRLGAVSFAGGSREMTAQQLPLRQEFWSAVLSGQSVGMAHRRSQNTGFLILREAGDSQDAVGYRHTLFARTLLGDPAVTVHLPAPPRLAPARTTQNGERLTVHAPEQWDSIRIFVPPDWKKWTNRDLFVLRAGGAYSLSHWGLEERDIEVSMVLAEFRSDKKIRSLALLDKPQQPLGWSGVWHSNRNRDGSYTHRFGVRMVDFNQETGKILHSVDRLEFTVLFE